MRWLITGGCGFIGRNLIRRIAARSRRRRFGLSTDAFDGTREELRAVVDFAELDAGDPRCEWTDWTRSRVEFVAADIRDADAGATSWRPARKS